MDDARGLYEDLLTASTQYYPHCLNAKWPPYALYLAPCVLFSALHLTKPIDRTTLPSCCISSQFNERFEYKCQDCVCLESTKTVNCKPKVCSKPPVEICTGPGFVYVNQTDPTDPCCSNLACRKDLTTPLLPYILYSVLFQQYCAELNRTVLAWICSFHMVLSSTGPGSMVDV